MKKYGLSETSSDINIRKISSVLDTRLLSESVSKSLKANNNETLEDRIVTERNRMKLKENVKEGVEANKRESDVVQCRDKCGLQESEAEMGEVIGLYDGKQQGREKQTTGENQKWTVEKDRAWLTISRQIMLDISKSCVYLTVILPTFSAVRTFPTHRMFSGETDAKISLFRVLMMYSQYNNTVGYCQGETFTYTVHAGMCIVFQYVCKV